MTVVPHRKVLVTGAAGGMGRASARLFGATDDLVLTDVSAERLGAFAEELRTDSYNVSDHAGDLSDPALIAKLVGEVSADGRPFAVVHTAGLSPSLAGWQAIMQVNLVASELLMNALEAALIPGSVAVLIASSAGYMMPAVPEIDAVLQNPLADSFMDAIEPVMMGMGGANSPGGMAGISYTLSKRAIHTMVQRRSQDWGPKGCRIASISPGMIDTFMGRSELANTGGAK
jgi:NAD(P)-dependent dehydrogenase (short-subunit alcohol dehydrogenase family)